MLFLYKSKRNANIKIVLTVIVVVFTLIIFPIFLNIDLCFIKSENKLFFKIKIFLIKIISGYAEIINEGIIFHLTKTKAIILPFNKIFDMKKSVEPLKDYHFIKIKMRLVMGSDYSSLPPLIIAFLSNYSNNLIRWLTLCKKPYVKFDNDIIIYEDQSVFKLYFNAYIVFNLLMVLLSIIKILVGKLIYANK